MAGGKVNNDTLSSGVLNEDTRAADTLTSARALNGLDEVREVLVQGVVSLNVTTEARAVCASGSVVPGSIRRRGDQDNVDTNSVLALGGKKGGSGALNIRDGVDGLGATSRLEAGTSAGNTDNASLASGLAMESFLGNNEASEERSDGKDLHCVNYVLT